MSFIVYKATFPNLKVYIGVTSQNLQARINQHNCKNSTCTLFHKALRSEKNKDKVIWEVLDTFDNKEDALTAEIQTIAKYKSNNRNFGYNLTNGGEGTFGLKRPYLLQKVIDNSGNIFNGYEEACAYYSLTRAQVRGSIVSKSFCGQVYFSKYVEGMKFAEERTISRKYRRRVVDHVNGITFFSVADICSYHSITQAYLASMCRKKNNPKFSYMDEV